MISHQPINIYFDMDGVIVDYDLINHRLTQNEENTFLNKSPIYTVIEISEKLDYNYALIDIDNLKSHWCLPTE